VTLELGQLVAQSNDRSSDRWCAIRMMKRSIYHTGLDAFVTSAAQAVSAARCTRTTFVEYRGNSASLGCNLEAILRMHSGIERSSRLIPTLYD